MNLETFLIGLVALVVFGVAQVWLIGSISAGRRPRFRAIPLFSSLRAQLGHAIESGRDLHVAIGTGGIGGEDMAQTLAAVGIVEYLADEAAASGVAPIITTADATALILTEDTLRRPYIRQGDLSNYPPLSARLPALNATQYAATRMDYLAHNNVLANVLSGAFGPEAALINHEVNKQDMLHFNAAADPRALAVLLPSSDNLLIGEEMFAAKAYLQARPQHLASLRAADLARWLIVIGIIAGFVLGMLPGALGG
jgi:hypothetical protein